MGLPDNVFTKAVLNVVNGYHEMKKEAAKKKVTPFMMEQVSNEGAKVRYKGMAPEERQALIKEQGLEAIMKSIGGGNATT